jgi:hypothetical protein
VRSSFTVTDNSDSAADVNSLRYAIDNLASGTAASANTITIAVSGGQTISLGSLLDINEGVTISAPGASEVAISGGNAVGVFKVESGVNASITGMAITNGASSVGGAIQNLGTLSIANCTLSGNSATTIGGALYNAQGSLSLANCTISGNSAGGIPGGGGGAIYDFQGSVSITNSTISGNSAGNILGGGTGVGGAICDIRGSMSITNSTISGNSTSSFGGGGIYTTNAPISSCPAKILCRELAELLTVRLPGC